MFPPPPQPKSPRTVLYATIAVAAAAAIAATILVLSEAFSSEDGEPVTIATGESETSEEAEPTGPEQTPTEPEPTEEATPEGGTYTRVDDLCALMEPIVSEYMTIDPQETEVDELGDATTCTMAGEPAGTYDRPYVSVEQDIDPALPSNGVEEYGFNEYVRSGCTVEEGVLPEVEASAYYHGDASDGCVILGHKYALDAADGDMFVTVLISFGTEGGSLGGEERLATDLAEAVIAAS